MTLLLKRRLKDFTHDFGLDVKFLKTEFVEIKVFTIKIVAFEES